MASHHSHHLLRYPTADRMYILVVVVSLVVEVVVLVVVVAIVTVVAAKRIKKLVALIIHFEELRFFATCIATL